MQWGRRASSRDPVARSCGLSCSKSICREIRLVSWWIELIGSIDFFLLVADQMERW